MRLAVGVVFILCLCSIVTVQGAEVRVTVPIAPYGWMLGELTGDTAAVSVLIPPGQSPHTFDPTPRQIVRLGQSDLYFWIGLPFEEKLRPMLEEQFSNLRIVDLRQGITLNQAAAHHDDDGASRDVHAESIDPHIWMSPQRLRRQAATACQALVDASPADSMRFHDNRRRVQAQLDSLDAFIRQQLSNLPHRTFFIHHPALGYLAADYNLTQRSIEFEGKAPTAGMLAEQLQGLTGDSTNTLFMDRQNAGRQIRDMMESLGIRVAAIDPLAGNYIDNMRRITVELRRALSAGEAE